jgi:hypothetical protein
MGSNLPKQQAGRPIAAETLNRAIDSTGRQSRLRTGKGLSTHTISDTPYIRSTRDEPIYMRVTGGASGVHAWQGVYEIDGGGWADLPTRISDNAGDDPLYEANGRTIPAGTIVEATRGAYSGIWLCQLDNCPS